MLVYYKNDEDHINHLRIELNLLREHKLFSKFLKYKFWLRSIVWLGHIISREGISMNSEKMKVVVDWPRISNLSEVRSFLRLASYYERYVKKSHIASPLTKLIRKKC